MFQNFKLEFLKPVAQKGQSALNNTPGAALFVRKTKSGCVHSLLIGNNRKRHWSSERVCE